MKRRGSRPPERTERAAAASGQGASSALLVYIRPAPTSTLLRSSAINAVLSRPVRFCISFKSKTKSKNPEYLRGGGFSTTRNRPAFTVTSENQGLVHGTELHHLMNA